MAEAVGQPRGTVLRAGVPDAAIESPGSSTLTVLKTGVNIYQS